MTDSEVSVAETYYRRLDQGEYLCSMSSMHRIARAEKIAMASTGGRRRRRAHRGEAVEPVLVTKSPGQIVCWDISYLPGKYRGVNFALYLFIDLYSRMILGWTIQNRESDEVAKELMEGIIEDLGDTLDTVHSDNGAAMTSKKMRKLLNGHEITQSLIRPGVSNDNAQVESFFRTVKYGPTWPETFDDIHDATTWFEKFAHAYNEEHHHTGLAGFTPAQVFTGTWTEVADQRQTGLDSGYAAHPGSSPGKWCSDPSVRGVRLSAREGHRCSPRSRGWW